MDIQNLRKYRIQFETWPLYNDQNLGISLFDLIIAFVGAWILDSVFNGSSYIPFCKNKRLIYYLFVIPFGIVVHHLIAHIRSGFKLFPEEITYLNRKLFTTQLNRYHVIIFALMVIILQSC